jgi:hypothetical protein
MLRVGWDPKQVIPKIYILLGSDKIDEVDVAIDFVRSLSESYPGIDKIITANKDILFSMLLSVNNETR